MILPAIIHHITNHHHLTPRLTDDHIATFGINKHTALTLYLTDNDLRCILYDTLSGTFTKLDLTIDLNHPESLPQLEQILQQLPQQTKQYRPQPII